MKSINQSTAISQKASQKHVFCSSKVVAELKTEAHRAEGYKIKPLSTKVSNIQTRAAADIL